MVLKVAGTVMSKVLSNGKKVLIEDATILGKARRHLSVYDKEGKLLQQRVKYWVKEEPKYCGFGDFKANKVHWTIDSHANHPNSVIRVRHHSTDYGLATNKYSASRPYPDIDVNGKKTAIFNVFKSFFEERAVVDKALFNIDGTINKTIINKGKYIELPTAKNYRNMTHGVKLEYPPIHSPQIDKFC